MRLRQIIENTASKNRILQSYERLPVADKAAFQELLSVRKSDFRRGEKRSLGGDEFQWMGAQWRNSLNGKVASKSDAIQLSTNQQVSDRVAQLYNSAKDQDLVKSLDRRFKLQRAGERAQAVGDKAGDVAGDLAGSLRKATGGVAPAGAQKQRDDELTDIVNKLKQSNRSEKGKS